MKTVKDINKETITDTTDIAGNLRRQEDTKPRKRKKMRRLVDSDDPEKRTKAATNECKRIFIITLLILSTIILLTGDYFRQNNSNTKQIFKNFVKNYRNQYIEIVHGKSNYCDQNQKLDTATLFAVIKQNHILHQEQALYKIKIALRNESDINTIVLMGPTGVGKTLFIRALQQNFPWLENVHSYSWNTYVNDEAKKFHLIRILIENLSECGLNLLVIDNLKACDYGAISIINQLLIDANKEQHKRVVLFYVFSLNTMLPEDEYLAQKDLLQSLTCCKIVNFKPFSHKELVDCIQREAEIENVTLTKEDFDEIYETIDPVISGCKNVNAKVLMYGTIKTK